MDRSEILSHDVIQDNAIIDKINSNLRRAEFSFANLTFGQDADDDEYFNLPPKKNYLKSLHGKRQRTRSFGSEKRKTSLDFTPSLENSNSEYDLSKD